MAESHNSPPDNPKIGARERTEHYTDYVLLHGPTDFDPSAPVQRSASCAVKLLESRPPGFAKDILGFLWPLEAPRPLLEPHSTLHSFLLTDITGTLQYVHCLQLWLRPDPTSPFYLPHSIAICTKFKLHTTFQQILSTIRDSDVSVERISDLVSDLFSTLYIPTTAAEPMLCFKLLTQDFTTHNPCYTFPADCLPPVDTNYETLFRTVEPRYIILVFTALMTCDCSVLLISTNANLLFSVCECLLCLLYPFEWPVSYIPVLPRENRSFDLIHVPQVSMMGLCTDEAIDAPDYTIIIDFNKDTVTGLEFLETRLPIDITWRLHRGIQRFCALYPGAVDSPIDLPSYSILDSSDSLPPMRKRSTRNRYSIVGRLPTPRFSYEDLTAMASGSDSDDDMEMEVEISFNRLRSVFLSVYVSLLQGYRSYLIIPNESQIKNLSRFSYFRKDVFVDKHARREDKKFLRKWVKSQIFSHFVHNRLTLSREDHFERMLRKKYVSRKTKKQRLESTGICGVMWKMGRQPRTWRKRFFMLQQNVLSYFSSVNELLEIVQMLSKAKHDLSKARGTTNVDALKCLVSTLEQDLEDTAGSKIKGSMELPINRTTIEIPEENEVHGTMTFQSVPTDHSFSIRTPDRTLLLAAQSTTDRRSWIEHIRARTTLLTPNPEFQALPEPIWLAVVAHRTERLRQLR